MPLTDMHDGLLSAHSVFPSQVYRDQAWQIWDRISSPATGGTNRREMVCTGTVAGTGTGTGAGTGGAG